MDIVDRLLQGRCDPGSTSDPHECELPADECLCAIRADAAAEIRNLRLDRDQYKDTSICATSEKRRLWNLAQGCPADCNDEGPRCRDCADFNGRCQGTGAPCDPQEAAEERIVNLRKERDEARAALEQANARLARVTAPYLDGFKACVDVIESTSMHFAWGPDATPNHGARMAQANIKDIVNRVYGELSALPAPEGAK